MNTLTEIPQAPIPTQGLCSHPLGDCPLPHTFLNPQMFSFFIYLFLNFLIVDLQASVNFCCTAN